MGKSNLFPDQKEEISVQSGCLRYSWSSCNAVLESETAGLGVALYCMSLLFFCAGFSVPIAVLCACSAWGDSSEVLCSTGELKQSTTIYCTFCFNKTFSSGDKKTLRVNPIHFFSRIQKRCNEINVILEVFTSLQVLNWRKMC